MTALTSTRSPPPLTPAARTPTHSQRRRLDHTCAGGQDPLRSNPSSYGYVIGKYSITMGSMLNYIQQLSATEGVRIVGESPEFWFGF